jgi:hypothetical protein
MCFSAGASFAAGAIISATGAGTSLAVKEPRQRLFAYIPFIFGVQQIAEGFLWLALQDPDFARYKTLSAYFFLVIADIVWPFLIPLSVLLMEKDSKRRRLIRIFLYGGILLSLYYGICMLLFRIDPRIMNCHIQYSGEFPQKLMLPAFLLYITVTVAPLFISTVRGMYVMGILMFTGCVVSVIFYTQNVTSVWCFFAALMSIIILWILKYKSKAAAKGDKEDISQPGTII